MPSATAPRDDDGQFLDPSPSLVKRLVHLVKQAGAPSEASTKRDGFLSYHAESHAVGVGLAAGWYFGATGEAQLLSLVYGAAVYGTAHARNGKRRKILEDVRQEWHYAVTAAVIGAVAGVLTGLAMRLVGIGG